MKLRIIYLLCIITSIVSGQSAFTCKLTIDKAVYTVGETPALSVEITNNTDSAIYLVNALEASDLKWRYPYSYVEIEKIGDTTFALPQLERCGNYNDIEIDDFLSIKPYGTFNPIAHYTPYAFDKWLDITGNVFSKGKYKVVYFYNTNESNFNKWKGSGVDLKYLSPQEKTIKNQITNLFNKVPRIELKSNEVFFEIQ